MVTTRKGSKTNADKNNAETSRTPGGANGAPRVESEASSHVPPVSEG